MLWAILGGIAIPQVRGEDGGTLPLPLPLSFPFIMAHDARDITYEAEAHRTRWEAGLDWDPKYLLVLTVHLVD